MTLRERRKAKGLTAEQVAKKMNVHWSAVYRWETGQRKPWTKHQKKLAKLYGCTVDELLEE